MKIIGVVLYERRQIALVQVGKKLVPMYKSTGSAGKKGEWFPFAGIYIPAEDASENEAKSMLFKFDFMMPRGWIIKYACYLYHGDNGKTKIKLSDTEAGKDHSKHRDPVARRSTTDADFDINLHKVAKFLKCFEVNNKLLHEVTDVGVNIFLRQTAKDFFGSLK